MEIGSFRVCENKSMMTSDQILDILRNVPESHEFFVTGVMNDIMEFGTGEEIASFIADNPDATAGEVAEYSTKLAGIL